MPTLRAIPPAMLASGCASLWTTLRLPGAAAPGAALSPAAGLPMTLSAEVGLPMTLSPEAGLRVTLWHW